MLRRALPDTALNELGELHLSEPSSRVESVSTTPQVHSPRSSCSRILYDSNLSASDGLEPDPSDDEYDCEIPELQDRLNDLSINHLHTWLGKSSEAGLVRKAMHARSEYSAVQREKGASRPSDPSFRLRADYWKPLPWERIHTEVKRPSYDFPDPDLLQNLVDLYFRHLNDFMPLFHRPAFDQSLADGLHYRNSGFGKVVLLVCAVGAKYSNDPRVLLEGTNDWYSAGYKWFSQVEVAPRLGQAPPSLYDLQMHAVAVMYLYGSPTQACWITAGVGVRLAIDAGAHRKRMYKANLTVEDELWKRAFWVLLTMDVMMSFAFGRPCAIREEEYDVDFPTECDDMYWTHPDPEQAFKQPPGKPCKVSFFISLLKLSQIQSCALRTIYSTNKSKALLGFQGPEWEQRVVSTLDSELKKWYDSLPIHLRWDSTRDDAFFMQSACLCAEFNIIQILIHRPFIRSPATSSSSSISSLAICTNAARSCARIFRDEKINTVDTRPPVMQLSAFLSAIVLLVNAWGVNRSGISLDPAKEMEEVYTCMSVLKQAEGRDVLTDLASCVPAQMQKPQSSSNQGRIYQRGTLLNPDSLLSESVSFIDSLQSSGGSSSYRDPSYEPSVFVQPMTAAKEHRNSRPTMDIIHSSQDSAATLGIADRNRNDESLVLSSHQSSASLSDPLGSFQTPHASATSTVGYPRPDSDMRDAFLQPEPQPTALATYPVSPSFSLPLDMSTSPNVAPSQSPPFPAGQTNPVVDPFILPATSIAGTWPDLNLEDTMQAEDDTITMWDTMPSTFGLDDWDMYLQQQHQT
ncbi:hypothetical protein EW146_g6678 [Bondarzewia mesenterica]|uniref:Xylanolytic transcriptional activator regulatory domain-containing protein n=1 Tax=Bondarzewia mesenterica TaxID=1095465 RepID=A0A4S4LMV3_9AGAM|nr:hypothetical protein EW146_g6678 [Bondarzewia mesenterica]